MDLYFVKNIHDVAFTAGTSLEFVRVGRRGYLNPELFYYGFFK